MPLDDRLADEVKQASRSIATVEFFGRDYWWEDVGRRQFSISFMVKSLTLWLPFNHENFRITALTSTCFGAHARK